MGEPQGKARPRVVKNIHTGKSIAYTPKKTVDYEEHIRQSYNREIGNAKFDCDKQLDVVITAYFKIPKSKSKRIKELMLSKILRPTKKPDCDNIAKIVCDALNGVAYKDDAQIVSLTVNKYYSDTPYVVVEISD